MKRCNRCNLSGPEKQTVCLRCGGTMISDVPVAVTGGIDYESFNMGYKDNFVNTWVLSWASFKGRASRGNYWRWMVVYTFIVGLMYAISAAFGYAYKSDMDQQIVWILLSFVLFVFFTVPLISITVRRLHDVNQSGWLVLLGLIPVVGPLILLNWTVRAGDEGENRYGEPRYTRIIDEEVGKLYGLATSPDKNRDIAVTSLVVIFTLCAMAANTNTFQLLYANSTNTTYTKSFTYDKPSKPTSVSHGLEAKISFERYFEEIVKSRYNDAYARLAGDYKKKYVSREAFENAVRYIDRVDYNSVKVKSSDENRVVISYTLTIYETKKGEKTVTEKTGEAILEPSKYSVWQITEAPDL